MRRPAPTPRLLVLLALLGPFAPLAAAPAAAAAPQALSASNTAPAAVEVTLAPGPHTVGDRVEAVLAVTVPAGRLTGEPRFPVWPEDGSGAWGEAEVVEVGAVEKQEGAGATTFRQRLVLAAFTPGRVALPPLGVALPYADATVEARTPADLALALDSVLPPVAEGAPAPAPRPPAPPRALPLGAAFWWTAGALAAACLALAALAFWRARRAAATAAVGAGAGTPVLDPFAELTAGVELARRAGSVAVGHTLLSRAVRRYLGRALRFPAPESTTSEIQRALAGRSLPAGTSSRLVELLRGCDLVKFARLTVEPAVLAARAETAITVAAGLERHLRPPPQPIPGEPPAEVAA